MIIVTIDEFQAIQDLALRCHTGWEADPFNEPMWEAGLRLILGSSIVDEIKRIKREKPDADFPVRVGEWLSRS